MRRKAIIISIKGTSLTKKEKNLLIQEKPWGIILFDRNLKSIKQIKQLTSKIKNLTGNRTFPIMIDEEGRTVTRLKKIINHNLSANFFGNLFRNNKNFCLKMYKLYLFSVCDILKDLGINVNTIPVLDIVRYNTNKIIGNRSFSNDKHIVKILGNLTIDHLHSNKIAGVIKHIPGHGASKTDSHKRTPIVQLDKKRLNEIDFYPFKASKARMGMTAHIVYSTIDKNNVATFSKKIINEVIRKKIGYKGILMSDDISMKALKHNLLTNAKKSLAAGCNLVLYCAGKTDDNLKLIKSLPYIDKFTSKKTSELYKFLR